MATPIKDRRKSATDYPTDYLARRAAREVLGRKAKRGVMYVTYKNDAGRWEWINASWQEIKTA